MSKSLPKGADYWKFGFMFFLFFAMDGTVIPYLSYWLHDVKHLDAYRIGVVFSVATAVALVLQPFVAVLTDKMDNRKQHVWVLIAAALFYAPFMVYGVNAAFGLSVWLAVVMYGLFIGFVSYTAGPFFEAYLEKAGRGSDIEYGQTCITTTPTASSGSAAARRCCWRCCSITPPRARRWLAAPPGRRSPRATASKRFSPSSGLAASGD